jgi:hypothetical protein
LVLATTGAVRGSARRREPGVDQFLSAFGAGVSDAVVVESLLGVEVLLSVAAGVVALLSVLDGIALGLVDVSAGCCVDVLEGVVESVLVWA